MRIAIIDLGTNTFHILIVDTTIDGTFKEIYRKRVFVQLGEEGVKTLGDAALQRGFDTLKDFKQTIDELGVERTKANGTAALRTATNGPAFVQKVKAKIDLQIDTISGDKEAELIYYGVRQCVPMTDEAMLIMDIGGGSVEFIIANKHKAFWAQSFPIGVAVLFKQFHHSNPISKQEITAVRQYLNKILIPLKEALKQTPIHALIGASGTFEVIETIVVNESTERYSSIQSSDFYPIFKDILPLSLAERLTHRDIPTQRAELIIVALLLIDCTLEISASEQLLISSYAMKEGILWEMLN